ncbi:similar to Saccharomyces cerevisiae YIL076W SEC28 Epsilon-COP subunit of the coatomer [Maudiozyma barnettii]|uniref:Coatomer subunit epsilon n=1 Tax=Maudiozyma barnettii TaxID=61262 RepID=A0A8H2VBI6_9SACH|nr:coatomer subunit epsilon [Kazachstania barnettii]CAB4252231.1 similar to Saccharomyces cerevisiae YIL076W SEC28 Epsilon-COP subunit of the coatomer [Kazachstania barnettii]CAD1778881.1 similar to Saccharomyces cerevisiae YIL076W SEC28 Epsilon-COP subunit of the coatomer [Kazachstania barnettii]
MDYFNIIQNYYTGNYTDCLKEVEKNANTDDNVLTYYKSMSQLALKKYTPGSSSSSLSKSFDEYATFLKNKDTSKLKSSIAVGSSNGFQLNLLAAALTIIGELTEALDLCVKGLDSITTEEDRTSNGYIELSLLAVQIALLKGDQTAATNIFYSIEQRLTLNNEAEIIQNLAEAYVKFAKNEDTSGLNFYYFEELAQTYPNWKTQLGLLNLHLQQGNIAEAQGIVDVLQSDYYQVEQTDSAETFKPHFIASKISLSAMQGLDNVETLKKELVSLDPEHPLIKNDKEVNIRFDELVAKFKN